MNLRCVVPCVLALSLGAPAVCAQSPLPTSFTYQGRLEAAGAPYDGPADLTFRLFDAPMGGAQVDNAFTLPGVDVDAGLFSVQLNFGTEAFSNGPVFLEIEVHDGGASEILAPRQLITAAPVAKHAAGAIRDLGVTFIAESGEPEVIAEQPDALNFNSAEFNSDLPRLRIYQGEGNTEPLIIDGSASATRKSPGPRLSKESTTDGGHADRGSGVHVRVV